MRKAQLLRSIFSRVHAVSKWICRCLVHVGNIRASPRSIEVTKPYGNGTLDAMSAHLGKRYVISEKCFWFLVFLGLTNDKDFKSETSLWAFVDRRYIRKKDWSHFFQIRDKSGKFIIFIVINEIPQHSMVHPSFPCEHVRYASTLPSHMSHRFTFQMGCINTHKRF